MKINNRRYIGCKTKLLDFIENDAQLVKLYVSEEDKKLRFEK